MSEEAWMKNLVTSLQASLQKQPYFGKNQEIFCNAASWDWKQLEQEETIVFTAFRPADRVDKRI